MKYCKNVEQQINHRNSWEETRYSRENKNQGDINIGTTIQDAFLNPTLSGFSVLGKERCFVSA